MEESLFPVFDIPHFMENSSDYDRRYKRSPKWDAEKGDFVRNSANQVIECDGKEAFAIWCFKIAQTERYACLAYPNSIGTEMEKALKQSDVKIIESMTERTITEALMVNPRTEYVRDFVFYWGSDDMHCSFLVKGINCDNQIQITV